jgi:hypothetical protein
MTLPSSETSDYLGNTGDTVVYICPQGMAYKFRGHLDILETLKSPDLFLTEQPTLLEAQPTDPEHIIQDLLRQGLLTPGQVQVGRYDHEMTGTSPLEALVARGWISQQILEDFDL